MLENNAFAFNGNNLIQIKGMTIGMMSGPVYENSIMGYLEQHYY